MTNINKYIQYNLCLLKLININVRFYVYVCLTDDH